VGLELPWVVTVQNCPPFLPFGGVMQEFLKEKLFRCSKFKVSLRFAKG
jgi:hypothetical protein